MQAVGIRELKDNATQLLRRVREEQVSIDITYYGDVVARLVPVAPKTQTDALWTTLEQLSAEIGAAWQGSSDVNAIMAEERA
jgi:prevent-host-death family protein